MTISTNGGRITAVDVDGGADHPGEKRGREKEREERRRKKPAAV
jgi:hypothetical protein